MADNGQLTTDNALSEQVPVPGVGRSFYPASAANVAEALGGHVEDRGLGAGRGAERVAGDGTDLVGFAVEDAVGVEDLDAELMRNSTLRQL